MDEVPKKTRPLKRALFAAAMLAGLLLLGEAALALSGAVGLFRPLECADLPGGEGRSCRYRFNERTPPAVLPKPAGAVRVLVVGESAVNGYPFDGAGWPESLGIMLNYSSPPARYEVVNLGVNGVNTDFLRAVLEDALPVLDADVVIVYAGNNEILGREPVDRLAHPRLKSAIWWLRRHSRLWNVPSHVAGFFLSRGAAVGLMLDIARAEETVGDWDNPPGKRRHARELYLCNIGEMVKLCRENGAVPVICAPGSNLAGWIPMKSVHQAGMTDKELARVGQFMKEGRALLAADDPAGALPLFEKAAELDPEYARAWHFLGRARLGLGQEDKAREAFEAAVRYSDFFQRTPPGWNEALREYARREGVVLIDTESLLARRSDRGVSGFDMFVDGCHPTLRGHYELARIVCSGLADAGLVEAPADQPGPGAVLGRTGVPRPRLGLALFNQATVLAFLHDEPEYYGVAADYIGEAEALGLKPVLGSAYIGYLLAKEGMPEDAAKAFTRARADDEANFFALTKNKLGAAMRADGNVLCVTALPRERMGELYPSGEAGEATRPGPADCDFRFVWTGAEYVYAPR